MSKVKHTMEANGTTVCGRTISENGQGADCKQCAARVARNAERVAAMVPSGNGLVEVEAIGEDAKTLRMADKAVKAYDRWVQMGQRQGSRQAMAWGWAVEFAARVGESMPDTFDTHALLIMRNKARDMVESAAVEAVTPSLKAVTFDDVKEANGWMSTNVDAVTRTLPAGTEVKPGFWNCCRSKPVIAVEFTDGDGGIVWRATCAADASTVQAERLAKLPSERPDDAIVLTGEQIRALTSSVRLMGYRTAARSDGRMSLARNFRPTVKGFNADYGYQCKTWADVRAVLIAAGVKGVKP